MSSSPSHVSVTYTSISSDDDLPSWGIPLMDAYESDPEAPKVAHISSACPLFTSSCSCVPGVSCSPSDDDVEPDCGLTLPTIPITTPSH
ncbi:hypothetical protein Tco_0755245 [Tanacetum coccineum]